MARMKTSEINAAADNVHELARRTPEHMKLAGPEIELLLKMALSGDVPNGKFGDVECSVWEIMRRTLRENNVEVGKAG